ncbi:MAG: SPOR domain-containing protein [Sphingomonas sp.]|jgi:rare lipoprotein A|uniref:SPOR domain-containing protein n=1 Tax=Sphingomonas sp. TaxID=28214 RepID=UPI003566E079
MATAIFLLAALAAQAGAARPSPGASDSPVARMPVSSLDAPPPELPQGPGPRGTSGEQRYDATGYAGVADVGGDPAAITATSDAVAQGGFVEITALDSGKTIVALVNGHGSGANIVDLSPGAARLLGIAGGPAGVRVRTVTPIPQDQVALRSGHAASPRIDAPQSLLVGLRKRLPAVVPPRPIRRPLPPTRPSPQAGASYAMPDDVARREQPPLPAPVSPRTPGATYAAPRSQAAPSASGWYVQVAALSSLARAQALVGSLGGGRVVSSGGLHRVQIGPYGAASTAARARDDAVRRGYAGARLVHE